MLWFKKNKLIEEEQHGIEVAIEKEIKDNVAKIDKKVKEAVKVGEKLNEQVQENGFTLKIYIATGGKLKGAHK